MRQRRRPDLFFALLLSAPLVLSGCIYKSKVAKTKFRLPAGYRLQQTKTAQKVGRWWSVFADPALDRLLKIAFAESLTVKQARHRVEQSRQAIIAGRAGWFPTIGAQFDASRAKRVINPQFQFTQNQVTLSAVASYEFDIFGKTYFGYKSAKHGHAAAYEQMRAAYISLAAQIADVYFLAVAARAQSKLMEDAIKNRKAQLELVERRYRVGVVTAYDLYQAKGTLATAKAQKVGFDAQATTAEHALAVLCGRYPGEIAGVTLDKLPENVRELPLVAPKKLLFTRPDLRAAHRQLLASDMRVGQALAAHFPTLSLSFNPGYLFEPTTGFIWSIGGSLFAPLFQGGRIHAEYKRAKAALREQIDGFKALLRNAVKEVRDAVVLGRAHEKRIKLLEESVKSAQGALRLSTDQYSQGLLTYINVLSAEQSVTSARSQLIAARQALITARISLARALGGTWVDKVIADKERARKKGSAKNRKNASRASKRNPS